MEEPTEQSNDNSIRQAESIETKAELDAAILAAIQRANEARSMEPSADASDEPLFADDNLMGDLIDPSYEQNYYAQYEDKDLSLQAPISLPVEEVKPPQPDADNVVLGCQNLTLASSVVLGGIEGVKRRLASTVVEEKIAALKEALNYGQAGLDLGLDLVVQALNHKSKSVAQAVYLQLLDSSNPLAQQVLQEYNPYRFFECTFSGRMWDLGLTGVTTVAISPDGQTLVCGSPAGTIKLWNLHTGEWLRSIRGHLHNLGYVYSIAVSPGGQILVSGSEDGTIKLWNLHTGEELYTLEGHSTSVDFVAISPDGQTLVSGSKDGVLEIWNLPTGKQLHILNAHPSGVGSIAISSDSRTLVSGGLGRRIKLWQDKSIKLWNLHNGEQINILKGHSDFVCSLAISPDGQTLVSGSGDTTIKLWNLLTGKHLHTLKGHSKWVSCLAISPDGQTLVSGSGDRTIKFWNLNMGQQLHTLEAHSSPVSSIAMSPDGQTLVSGSYDRSIHDETIKVWR